jgi:hemoglobin-like flavoprotein
MADATQHALFICYSHTDRRYREQFSKFLQSDSLRKMQIFSDAAIQSGDEWQTVILDHLQKATAALVLVSQDFMISPFIQQVELRDILTNHIRRGLRLFLVPVRATNYQGTYLEQFQWARPPDKPLSLLTEAEQEAAMVDVCLKITDLLTKDQNPPAIEHTIACLKSIPKLDLPSMYELEEPVGEGTFARCFKAHDHLLDRKVIIKVLNAELSRDSPAYDKYVRSASKLNHRNILGLLFSQANKLPHFIVTPAVGDSTLEKRLAGTDANPPPTFEQAVRCTMQLADTLAYAHRQGCVHGRLRPSEIRFDNEGEPVLSGFRTLAACAAASHADATARFTLEEFVYSSPEHRLCGTVDEKTDQYLLGLVAYEMISGAPPVKVSAWSSLLDPETARAIVHPRPLHEFVEECDERVSAVVMRMLSPEPEARWDSLEAVTKNLALALARNSCVAEAKASYRRCAQQDRFYQTLYEKLFAAIPEIQGMFRRRSMEEQYQVLRDALWLLLTYPETRTDDEPTILSGIARTHAHYESRHFDQFRDAVLDAVGVCDPGGAAVVEAWREAITPGLEYLKSKAGQGARATA